MGSMRFHVHVLNSEHAQYAVRFYVNAYWLNGLSMPTNVCSVCMPIESVNIKVRGDK